MKRILGLLFIFTICWSAAFAYPPVSSGTVTGPWMEDRGSYSHHGLDVGIPEGTPIRAPFDGYAEGAPGSDYVYWVLVTSKNGDAWLFGDCAFESENCARGEVKAGDIIGYVGGAYDGPYGYSSGAHIHFEYHPFGYNNGMVDPTPYLQALGVSLDGYVGGDGDFSGGLYGKDDKGVPWGVEGMYEIGNDFNKVIKDFSTAANKAFTYLQQSIFAYLAALCIIDLALPILIGGMVISRQQLITKIMKYAGLMGILLCWQQFTDNIVLNFITSVAGTYNGGLDEISANMSQPQLLLQHGIRMIAPGLNKAASFTTYEFVNNISTVLTLYVFTFLVMGAFIFLALYVTMVYIEFYVSASLCTVTVPFAAWRMTQFLPEGSVGHMISCGLKLLLLSIMIGFCVTCIKDAQPQEIFQATTTQGVTSGTGQTIGPADLVAMADEKADKYGIPKNLFEAIIQTESSWNPQAVSPVGAQGLGQLMPDTAAELGCSDPFDPEQNLDASAKYVKQLYDMFGDWDLVLAAYNGGPGAISPGSPLPDWATDYINHVKSNLNGTYVSHSPITADQLTKYIRLCLAIFGLIFLTWKVPRSIMQHLGGPIELPRS